MRPSDKILLEIRETLVARKLPDLRDKKKFVENLVFMYHCMKASETLLIFAKRLSHMELKEYYTTHLEEERGHHLWLLEDLWHAGVEAERTPCPAQVPPMVGSVYYHLIHRDPAALLGYMLVMEGSPIPEEMVAHLEQLHGKDLCQTLRYHAVHDVDHAKHLRYMIDNLPSERQEIVRQVALSTADLLSLGLSFIEENANG